MKIRTILLLCFAIAAIVVVSVAAYWVLNIDARVRNLAYDDRCGDGAAFVVSDQGRLLRLSNRNPITLANLENFSHYNDYWADVFEYFQIEAYDITPQLLSSYFDSIDKFTDINSITLAKLLPPKIEFLERPYHDLTMGVFDTFEDLDGDGIHDFVVGTADISCATGRLDYLVLSSKLRPLATRIELASSAAIDLSSPGWTEAGQSPTIKFPSHRSMNGSVLYNGRLVEISRFDDLPVNSAVNIDDIAPDRGWSDDAFFVGDLIVDIDQIQNQLLVFDGAKLEAMPSARFPLDLGQLQSAISLPDLDGDAFPEAVLVVGHEIVFVDPRDSAVIKATMQLPSSFRGEIMLGSVGDYDGDGMLDVWLAADGAETEDGDIIGAVAMLPGRALAQSLRADLAFEDAIGPILFGSTQISSRQKTGIGYDISLRGGDIDGDGLLDLAAVAHYTLDNAGTAYVLFGKDMASRSTHFVTDPTVARIRGAPLSYLGTGLDASSDWNGDGYDDIVVGADVDHEAGFSAGAIYILSGKAITEALPSQVPFPKRPVQ